MTKSGTISSAAALQAGDIVLLPFPYTDLSGFKKRPVLVVAQADGGGDFIAVPVTSQPGHANTVGLAQPDLADGTLPKPSWIKADKPYTLNSSLVLKRFGRVKPGVIGHVLNHLGHRLGILGSKP